MDFTLSQDLLSDFREKICTELIRSRNEHLLEDSVDDNQREEKLESVQPLIVGIDDESKVLVRVEWLKSTHILLLDLRQQLAKKLYCHRGLLQVVNCTLSEDGSLLGLVAIHRNNVGSRRLHYYQHVVELFPVQRFYALENDSALQQLYFITSGDTSCSYLLRITLRRRVILQCIPRGSSDIGLIVSSSGNMQNLNRRPIWTQYSSVSKRLYILYFSKLNGNVNRLCFGVFQFERLTDHAFYSFHQYLCVPLLNSKPTRMESNFKDDIEFYLYHMLRIKNEHESGNESAIPIFHDRFQASNTASDRFINAQALCFNNGAMVFGLQFLKNNMICKVSSSSSDTDQHEKLYETGGHCYRLFIINHRRMVTCSWPDMKSYENEPFMDCVLFTKVNGCAAVLHPHFLYLIEPAPDMVQCLSVVLTQSHLKFPNNIHNLTHWESRRPINLLLDHSSGRLFQWTLTNEMLLTAFCFVSSTHRPALLHFLLFYGRFQQSRTDGVACSSIEDQSQGLSKVALLRSMMEVLCSNPGSAELPALFQEVLTALTYQRLRSTMDRSYCLLFSSCATALSQQTSLSVALSSKEKMLNKSSQSSSSSELNGFRMFTIDLCDYYKTLPQNLATSVSGFWFNFFTSIERGQVADNGLFEQSRVPIWSAMPSTVGLSRHDHVEKSLENDYDVAASSASNTNSGLARRFRSLFGNKSIASTKLSDSAKRNSLPATISDWQVVNPAGDLHSYANILVDRPNSRTDFLLGPPPNFLKASEFCANSKSNQWLATEKALHNYLRHSANLSDLQTEKLVCMYCEALLHQFRLLVHTLWSVTGTHITSVESIAPDLLTLGNDCVPFFRSLQSFQIAMLNLHCPMPPVLDRLQLRLAYHILRRRIFCQYLAANALRLDEDFVACILRCPSKTPDDEAFKTELIRLSPSSAESRLLAECSEHAVNDLLRMRASSLVSRKGALQCLARLTIDSSLRAVNGTFDGKNLPQRAFNNMVQQLEASTHK